jgi:hypothetical protein
MATPLLKTVDALFARGAFTADSLAPQHMEGLLEAVKQEGRKVGDLARLTAVASVLCHLVRCGGHHAPAAAQVRDAGAATDALAGLRDYTMLTG